jgi:hypothetical protein
MFASTVAIGPAQFGVSILWWILVTAVATYVLQRQSEDSADNRATDVEILDVSQMLLAAVKRGDATASGHADE